MRRGTTPVHVFNVDKDLRGAKVYLTYRQDYDIITKTNDELEISENAIAVVLTQADTLKFNTSKPVEVQIRFVTDGGTADASNIIQLNVEKILKGGIISYE